MTSRSRRLGVTNSPPSPAIEAVDSDFVIILTALLCALICVLGLFAVSRCSWIQRLIGSDSPSPASRKGVKKKVLRSLPKLTYGEGNEEAAKLFDCAICLAEFAAGDEIRVLPQCGHGFHAACVDRWLASRASCPSCRRILEVARCQKCGSLPPTASCAASGLRPVERERQVRIDLYPYLS